MNLQNGWLGVVDVSGTFPGMSHRLRCRQDAKDHFSLIRDMTSLV